MPLFAIQQPPVLYRGDVNPLCAGDILRPNTQKTCCGDAGCFVFATHHYLHAGAYGWKAPRVSVSLYVTATNAVPIVFLLNTDKAFERNLHKKVYVQMLPTHSFLAVFEDNERQVGGAAEWVSKYNVRIKAARVYTNDYFLRAGVQVFTADKIEHFTDKGNYLDRLSRYLKKREVIWENMQPPYNTIPRAQCAPLVKRLEYSPL